MVECAAEQIRKLRRTIPPGKIRDEFDAGAWLEQKRQIREDQEGC